MERINHSECSFFRRLCAHLCPSYIVVECQCHTEMRLVVFARANLYTHIHRIIRGREVTGVGRVLGNKGGLAISFDVYGKKLRSV